MAHMIRFLMFVSFLGLVVLLGALVYFLHPMAALVAYVSQQNIPLLIGNSTFFMLAAIALFVASICMRQLPKSR